MPVGRQVSAKVLTTGAAYSLQCRQPYHATKRRTGIQKTCIKYVSGRVGRLKRLERTQSIQSAVRDASPMTLPASVSASVSSEALDVAENRRRMRDRTGVALGGERETAVEVEGEVFSSTGKAERVSLGVYCGGGDEGVLACHHCGA